MFATKAAARKAKNWAMLIAQAAHGALRGRGNEVTKQKQSVSMSQLVKTAFSTLGGLFLIPEDQRQRHSETVISISYSFGPRRISVLKLKVAKFHLTEGGLL